MWCETAPGGEGGINELPFWGRGRSEKASQVRSTKAFLKGVVDQEGDGEGSAGWGPADYQAQSLEATCWAGMRWFAFLGCGVGKTAGDGLADGLWVPPRVPPPVGLEAGKAFRRVRDNLGAPWMGDPVEMWVVRQWSRASCERLQRGEDLSQGGEVGRKGSNELRN